MRIGLGEQVGAWDGSNVNQKLADLLNEFYVPTTSRSVLEFLLCDQGLLMDVFDSHFGYTEHDDAIAWAKEGLESTKRLIDMASKRVAQAEGELQSVISTCGEKKGRFAGYVTYEDYLKSEHWQTVRSEALQRYDGKCALDSKHDKAVHVHHRTYVRLGSELPEDVIVLCSDCHARHHDKVVA